MQLLQSALRYLWIAIVAALAAIRGLAELDGVLGMVQRLTGYEDLSRRALEWLFSTRWWVLPALLAASLIGVLWWEEAARRKREDVDLVKIFQDELKDVKIDGGEI